MKTFKFSILAILVTATFAFTSCGGNQAEEQGKEYTSAYICPMHCEGSGSEQAGQCPVCGMDYVAKDEESTPVQNSTEHNHDHDHDHGHDHSHDH